MRADPGIGNAAAPVGTVEWAQSVRLTMQGIVHNLPKAPERFRGYVELCKEHRAWRLMNKADGSVFATFEEYCEHKEPWGLGKSYDELRPFLEAAMGKRRLQLVAVAPAQTTAEQPRGAHGHFDGKAAERPADGKAAERPHGGTKAVRAIAERAPEQIRDLYRQDLLGQKEAAKLGPKNPTPEEAAKVTEVAIVLAEKARTASKPTTEQERRRLKQTITAEARKMLGQETEDQVSRLLKTIKKLSADDLGKLFEGLRLAYGAEFEGPK